MSGDDRRLSVTVTAAPLLSLTYKIQNTEQISNTKLYIKYIVACFRAASKLFFDGIVGIVRRIHQAGFGRSSRV